MPPVIYNKDCKLKVIEYGGGQSDIDFIEDVKNFALKCFRKIIH